MDNNIPVGTILKNKYRIDEPLAEGGQGKIYRATDITSGINRQYIVKQFTPNYSSNFALETGTRLFNLESKTLQKLGKHSQIPQIFDYFEANQRFYLVQEFIEGQTLAAEFAQKKQLTAMELLPIVKDILDVVQFVHRNNCIHRDLKPSNLIRNQHDRKIYLIDFGTVKEKIDSKNIDSQGRIKRTVAIQTEGYTPIEQISGRPEFCSDIYAIGMLMVNALTGVHPSVIPKDDRYNPIWQNLLPTDNYKYNPNLLKLIDKMVRSNYLERYQSIDEVLADLQKVDDTIIGKPAIDNPHQPSNNNIDNTVLESDNKKPWLPWLGVGMGTIILGIVGFSFIPQEKYATYSNEQFNIAIAYPDSWAVQEDWHNFQDKGVKFLSPLENNNDKFQERITIAIEDLSTPLSLREYNNLAIQQIENNNTVIESATSTTFVNKQGTKIIYQQKDGNKKRLEYWTIKNQKAYIATYSAETDKFDKYFKQAEKAIASLAINNVEE